MMAVLVVIATITGGKSAQSLTYSAFVDAVTSDKVATARSTVPGRSPARWWGARPTSHASPPR
jgi:hypothetical protein